MERILIGRLALGRVVTPPFGSTASSRPCICGVPLSSRSPRGSAADSPVPYPTRRISCDATFSAVCHRVSGPGKQPGARPPTLVCPASRAVRDETPWAPTAGKDRAGADPGPQPHRPCGRLCGLAPSMPEPSERALQARSPDSKLRMQQEVRLPCPEFRHALSRQSATRLARRRMALVHPGQRRREAGRHHTPLLPQQARKRPGPGTRLPRFETGPWPSMAA